MTPSSSDPTPLNPRGRGGEPEPEGGAEQRPAGYQERSESTISNEAQAVRTLASAHRLAGEIENEARRRADEITAQAELRAGESERDARARAEAMVAEAKAERDRIWEQIRIGVGRATRQVGDLLRIREELRLDLHEAMRESRDAIERLEEGGSAEGPPGAPPAWLPGAPQELSPAPQRSTAPPPPPPPSPPITGRASEVRGVGSPLSPRGGAAPAPAPTRGASPAGEPAESSPQGGETLSSLRAGPFESFLEVMRFERDLAGLAEIDAVYVRRFSNGEVDVEVDTAAGADALIGALRGMPAVAAVQTVGGILRVRVSGEDPPPGD